MTALAAPTVAALAADAYHADPCATPSLSASVAHLLCSRSPLHAWAAHPRLNPDYQREESDRLDLGSAAHAVLLGGDGAVEVIDAPDWRTAAAREARDAARAVGRVPLLARAREQVDVMLARLREQLADHPAEPPLFSDGDAEQTLVWEERGFPCRARLDWLRHDLIAVDDYKTTSRSARPDDYARALFGVGGDIQAAWYLRGVERVLGTRPAFRWCVQETEPPHVLSVIEPGSDMLALAEKKVEYALAVWQRCLETDIWPGYPAETAVAALPPWEEERWLAKEERELG